MQHYFTVLSLTVTAAAAISDGDLIGYDDRPITAADTPVKGIAMHPAAAGDRVAILAIGAFACRARGPIAAGQLVMSAATGGVIAAPAGAVNPAGRALHAAASGGMVLMKLSGSGGGNSAVIEQPPVPTATAPAKVTGLIANVTGQDVELIWDAPSNGGSPITDYEVVQAATTITDPAQATALSDAAGDTSTSRNLAGLAYDTQRNWWVRAITAVGPGPWSDMATYYIGSAPANPTTDAAWQAMKAAAYAALDGTEDVTYVAGSTTNLATVKAAGTGGLTLNVTGTTGPVVQKAAGGGYKFINTGYLAVTGISPDAAKGMILVAEMTVDTTTGTHRGIYYSDSVSSGDAEVRAGSGFWQIASDNGTPTSRNLGTPVVGEKVVLALGLDAASQTYQYGFNNDAKTGPAARTLTDFAPTILQFGRGMTGTLHRAVVINRNAAGQVAKTFDEARAAFFP